jgi:hypothetical protein
VKGHIGVRGDSGGGSGRMTLEIVHEAQGGAGETSEVRYVVLVSLKEYEDAPGGACRLRVMNLYFQRENAIYWPWNCRICNLSGAMHQELPFGMHVGRRWKAGDYFWLEGVGWPSGSSGFPGLGRVLVSVAGVWWGCRGRGGIFSATGRR